MKGKLLKRALSVALSVLMIGSTVVTLPAVVESSTIVASAAETYGDFEYKIENGTVTITKYKGSGGNVTIPSSINGKSVTSIGSNAFYFCEAVTSITIPNSVTSIGSSAFQNCTGLTSITIPNSVINIGDDAFSCCRSLTSITIPNSVTSIGDGAFSCCRSLTSITIPNSVTSIGDFSFYICTGLTSINVDNKNTKYSSADGVLFDKNQTEIIIFPGGKKGQYSIPSSVTSIGYHAFSNCTGLTSVTIPDSVTSIGSFAFYCCESLTSITIPDSVTIIGMSAFNECTDLISVTIPDSVVSIGDGAFFDCTKLTIYGYTGSYAEIYANNNNIKFVSIGNVEIAVTGISLNKTSTTITKGSSETLTATITPSNATNKTVTWTTSNSSVATVSSGKVTAVAAGTATITAKSNNGKTATCTVTVTNPTVEVTGIKLNKTSATITKGNSETLTATITPSNASNKTVTWTTSNSKVATVSNGKVTAVAAGTATITAKTYNNKTAICTVTVTNPTVEVTSISLNKTSTTITKGNSETLTATITPSNATNKTVAWTTSNSSVATVSGGKVTAVAAGTATITAKTNNNKTATCTVTVKNGINKFEWNKDNWNFDNDYSHFGFSSYRNQINSTYLNKLKSNLTNSEYQEVFVQSWYGGPSWLDEAWGGSCYGMSSTSLLAKNGLLPYRNYKSGATKLYDLNYPLADENVSSLVTYYQMLQIKDVIQEQYRTIPYRTNEANIKQIISLLNNNSTVLLGFQKSGWGGHAILAYDYEYGSYTFNGVTYQGCIKICDPNYSMSYDKNANIYFNTSSYNWAIPAYSGITSSSGAKFNYIGANVDEINKGGYLSGTSGNYEVNDFVARIDAKDISNNRSVSKVSYQNGSYVNHSSGANEIIEDYSYVLTGKTKSMIGYTLFDPNSAYKVSQDNPEKMNMRIDYQDCDLSGYSAAGKAVTFDYNGFVSIESESAEYKMSLVFDKNYPTDWYSIQVSGTNADTASLKKTDEGYVLSANNLENIEIKANNKDSNASLKFDTTYDTVLIYEINPTTIGLKVDTDNNGTFETILDTTKSIRLDKTAVSIGVGENITLKAITDPTTANVIWSSSNKEVATVTNGKVTGKKAGTATITATSGKVKATCIITVKNAPSSVSLNKSAVSIGVGEKFSVSSIIPSNSAAVTRTYSSSNSSVVRMTRTSWIGEFVGVKPGTATVTVKLYNGKTAKCTVTVRNAPASVSLSKTAMSMGVGETFTLSAILPANTAAAVRTYSSSNSSIVQMTRTDWVGTFKAMKVGTATVTVKLYNGKAAKCTVTVRNAPASVSLSKTSVSMGVGETFTLSAILPANTAAAVRTYSSSNSSIVQMTRTDWVGAFKAMKVGTAKVTVKLYNGKTATCTVTVKEAPTSVKLNKGNMTLKVGQKGTVSAVIPTNAAAASRTYRSSNSSIVQMTKTNWTGEFVAKKVGTAYVTVRLYNGKEASIKVTVVK